MPKEVAVMNDSLRKLSNDDLVRRLIDDVARERAMTVAVLHDLNEVERRRLYLDLGCSSLFDYCVRKLKYSSSAAARRIQAARCIRRFPAVLRLLQANEISLTTVGSIAPVLNAQNCETILKRVRGVSCRQVERIACEYRPPLAMRDRVRPVRVVTPGAGSEIKQFSQFLADDEFVALFEEVRQLMSRDGHHPSMSDVLKTTLREYRDRHSPAARHERRAVRTGAAAAGVGESINEASTTDSRRREWNDATKSRHIPDEVRDAVFMRDQGRCAFVANDGTRCESRHGVQVDHIRPYALGGTHEPSNLRLLCAAHNRRAAELTLGEKIMQPFWRPA
jgi:5-methylcytosine-specific restriction endonuclease McrA